MRASASATLADEASLYSFLFKRGFVLPVTVTGIIPLTLTLSTAAWTRATATGLGGGAALIVFGLGMLASTTRLFARSHGSLAPWNPPAELVLAGPYRHSRNPMITGIYAILIGETSLSAPRGSAAGRWRSSSG